MNRIFLFLMLAACSNDKPKDGLDTNDDTDSVIDDTNNETDDNSNSALGPDDEYAEMACNLFEDDPTMLEAANSEADAGQVIIEPNIGVNFQVERQEIDGEAWFTLQVADWAVEIRIFTSEGSEYELLYNDGEVELLREGVNNGHCPDAGIVDQEFKIHSWGDYPLHFTGGNENPIRFTVIQED